MISGTSEIRSQDELWPPFLILSCYSGQGNPAAFLEVLYGDFFVARMDALAEGWGGSEVYDLQPCEGLRREPSSLVKPSGGGSPSW